MVRIALVFERATLLDATEVLCTNSRLTLELYDMRLIKVPRRSLLLSEITKPLICMLCFAHHSPLHRVAHREESQVEKNLIRV